MSCLDAIYIGCASIRYTKYYLITLALRILTKSIFTIHLFPYGLLFHLGRLVYLKRSFYLGRSTLFWYQDTLWSVFRTAKPKSQVTDVFILLTQEMTFIEKLRRPFHNPKDFFPFNTTFNKNYIKHLNKPTKHPVW